jgi:polysaccharide deacetylase family protein (PEP-CTERM system associated)
MNALTIDVEDWYHCVDPDPANWHRYEDRIGIAVRETLEVVQDAGVTATFFVLGDVARRHPGLVREIESLGHEIGSHGQEHRFIYHQTPQAFETDVLTCRRLLETIVTGPIRGYRAPYFSITRQSQWALPILRRLGFDYDSSIFPVVNHRYGIPDASRLPYDDDSGLREWPISVHPFGRIRIPYSGGFYFRFWPYRIIHKLFKSANGRGESVVFYLHPWELDAAQPRISMPMGLRWRHYLALDSTASKLRRLLRDFPFQAIRDLTTHE